MEAWYRLDYYSRCPKFEDGQMSDVKRGNIEAVGRSAANEAIVRSNAATTAGLVGAFNFST